MRPHPVDMHIWVPYSRDICIGYVYECPQRGWIAVDLNGYESHYFVRRRDAEKCLRRALYHLSYCSYCNALPGQLCRSRPTGLPAQDPHMDRMKLAKLELHHRVPDDKA